MITIHMKITFNNYSGDIVTIITIIMIMIFIPMIFFNHHGYIMEYEPTIVTRLKHIMGINIMRIGRTGRNRNCGRINPPVSSNVAICGNQPWRF